MQDLDRENLELLIKWSSSNTEQQVWALKEIVVDLMREIEALRSAMIDEAKSKGIDPKDSVYGKAYREAGLFTHNSAGPTPGRGKLFQLFASRRTTPNGIQIPEALMLLRLGYSQDEIAQYASEAELQEMMT